MKLCPICDRPREALNDKEMLYGLAGLGAGIFLGLVVAQLGWIESTFESLFLCIVIGLGVSVAVTPAGTRREGSCHCRRYEGDLCYDCGRPSPKIPGSIPAACLGAALGLVGHLQYSQERDLESIFGAAMVGGLLAFSVLYGAAYLFGFAPEEPPSGWCECSTD